MAAFTTHNGPIVPNADESPLFGKSVTLDGTAADANTIGQYVQDVRIENDQARAERFNSTSPAG